jgi:hypothetical protein
MMNNQKKQYRVVILTDSEVSPFPQHVWPTREQAEKFANEEAPNGWAGKLVVVENEVVTQAMQ